jgi:hypothetical protein
MESIEPKRYAGIDYDFRPESFWVSPSDPLQAILRNVKGRRRREMIRELLPAATFALLRTMGPSLLSPQVPTVTVHWPHSQRSKDFPGPSSRRLWAKGPRDRGVCTLAVSASVAMPASPTVARPR